MVFALSAIVFSKPEGDLPVVIVCVKVSLRNFRPLAFGGHLFNLSCTRVYPVDPCLGFQL